MRITSEREKDKYNERKMTAFFNSGKSGGEHAHFWKRIPGRENIKKCIGCGVESDKRPQGTGRGKGI